MPVNTSELTREQLLARIAELEAAQPSEQSPNKITYKVSAKGGVSMYGLGRFPVTLYSSQLERIVADAKAGAIDRFIEANRERLAVKQAAE